MSSPTTTTTVDPAAAAAAATLQGIMTAFGMTEAQAQQLVTMMGTSAPAATPMDSAAATALGQATATAMDTGHMLMMGALILFVQVGYMLLEQGSCMEKHNRRVVAKNVFCVGAAAMMWTVCGYAIAYPDAGGAAPITNETLASADNYATYFNGFAYAALASTITLGALAGRSTVLGYLMAAILMASFVYPVIVRWTWGGKGFPLVENSYTQVMFKDTAGAGVVHLTAGCAAVGASWIIGPRRRRFKDPHQFVAWNMGEVVFGTLALWFSWYGMTVGSSKGISGMKGLDGSRAATATTLAGASGGIVAMVIGTQMRGGFDLEAYCHGIIAGLVAVSGCCDNIDTPSAALSGALGGIAMILGRSMLNKMKIDDPLLAFPTHGAAGLVGVLMTGVADMTVGSAYTNDMHQLIAQIRGALVIPIFSFTVSAVLFGTLNTTGLLRMSLKSEKYGMDEVEGLKEE